MAVGKVLSWPCSRSLRWVLGRESTLELLSEFESLLTTY